MCVGKIKMNNNIQKARSVTKEDAEIGFRIRRIRQNKHISQEKVAEKCGISYQQLQKYERGRNRISARRLMQIADVLGVEAGDLLNDPANDKKPQNSLQKWKFHNIDETAARLWRKIKCDRQKYLVVELMDTLQNNDENPM